MLVADATIDCSPYTAQFEKIKSGLPELFRRDIRGYYAMVAEAALELPCELRERVAAFRGNGNELGLLYLRGLPVNQDALPDTPQTWPAPDDRPLLHQEAWVGLVAALLGHSVGYEHNRAGKPYQDVYPSPTGHWTSANNFKVPLRYHTEMAYHIATPDYIVIACVRPDHEKKARTCVASARIAADRLSDAHRTILSTVPLTWHVDEPFKSEHDPDPTTQLVMLPDDDSVRYDDVLIRPDEHPREVAEALTAYHDAAHATASSVHLEPGDVIVIDNPRTSHCRLPFHPRWDGQDRWLTRNFVLDPKRSGHSVNSADCVPWQIRVPEVPVPSAPLQGTASR